MQIVPGTPFKTALLAVAVAVGLFFGASGGPVQAQVTAFKQAVAEAAASDDQVAAYYRTANYQPLWTGDDAAAKARRAALFQVLNEVDLHGLPAARYRASALMAQMRAVRSTRDLGMVEVALSHTFVTYARDVQSGVLIPSKIDDGLVRKVIYRDLGAYLSELAASDTPAGYMRTLPPKSREYRALMKEKLGLEALMNAGGWGTTVPAGKFKLGQSGANVVALRNRLISMGYMTVSASASYDTNLEKAVQKFQLSHGLEADGVAGKSTIIEINKSVGQRLKSVVVAMERERWLPVDRGERYISVNLASFETRIIDKGYVTFRTRSVVGKNQGDRRSPEFSDFMKHMVINPSWYVPRSIIVKEYLPQLQNNPNAVGHILITDRRGRIVNRSEMDFTQFTRSNFPFSMRQPPSNRNALGLVKFMFPNKYAIYLHDTPAKSLFKREIRAFSHGCIRLADPFGFAYALLARQTDDPKGLFQSTLKTGKETTIMLEQPVPIHLMYRTAFTSMRGGIEFRRDVYGRDAKIWNALNQAGVELGAVQG